MPLSKTDICNMALAHCGHGSRIQDVDTDTTNAGIQCRLFYDQARLQLLEMRPWSFAIKQFTLQSLGTPVTNWVYRYSYPNDCARCNYIVNPSTRTPARGNKIPFKVIDVETGGKAILCDQADAVLEYNRDIKETERFTRAFGMAHSFMLASLISMPLRANAKITAYINQQLGFWMAEAATMDGNESQEDQEPVSEFESVRY